MSEIQITINSPSQPLEPLPVHIHRWAIAMTTSGRDVVVCYWCGALA